MWRDNFIKIFKESGITSKQLSERSGVSEKTIIRIIKNPNATTYLDTLDRLAIGLGISSNDITQDTKTVVGNETLAALQEKLDTVTAERDLIVAENTILKEKVTALTSENELLKMQLMHKDEIIALHNIIINLSKLDKE